MPINAVGLKIIAAQGKIHKEKLNAHLLLPYKEPCNIFITQFSTHVQKEIKFRLKDAEEKKNDQTCCFPLHTSEYPALHTACEQIK